MCFPFRRLALLVLAGLPLLARSPATLHVCADPNNLPYSNIQQQGFENKLAALIAQKLNAQLAYTWWPQRKSFATKSLDQGLCDVVMGVPTTLAGVLTTKPYYRSTYVFVSRTDRHLGITSLTDDRLSQLRIGIHMVGDDYAPPAVALAHRGITQNVTGFSLFGKYGEPNPPRKLIDAVEQGVVDVAIVWGPFAGYFSKDHPVGLDITPVSPPMFLGLPFTYEISAGVRKGNDALQTELNEIFESQAAGIRRILDQYGVPQLPETE
jgi:mxaJ protein